MRATMSRQAREQALRELVLEVGFRDAVLRDPIAAGLAVGIHLPRDA